MDQPLSMGSQAASSKNAGDQSGSFSAMLIKWCCKPCHPRWSTLSLRVLMGIVFILHGYGKLFGPNPGIEGFTGYLTSLNVVAPVFMAWLVSLVEFLGGIALLVGVATPLFASLLAIDMVFAWTLTKIGKGIIVNGVITGELDLALLAIAISLSLSGAGIWSVDAMLTKKNLQ